MRVKQFTTQLGNFHLLELPHEFTPTLLTLCDPLLPMLQLGSKICKNLGLWKVASCLSWLDQIFQQVGLRRRCHEGLPARQALNKADARLAALHPMICVPQSGSAGSAHCRAEGVELAY